MSSFCFPFSSLNARKNKFKSEGAKDFLFQKDTHFKWFYTKKKPVAEKPENPGFRWGNSCFALTNIS